MSLTTSNPSFLPAKEQSPPTKLSRLRLKSVSTKLFLYVLGSAVLGLGGLSYFFYQTLKNGVEAEIQKTLSNEVAAVQVKLTDVERSSTSLGMAARSLYRAGIKDVESYKNLAFQDFFRDRRPDLTMGVSLAQAPNALVPSLKWYYAYFYLDQNAPNSPGVKLPAPNNNIRYADLFAADNYPEKEYWTLPTKSGKPVWTTFYDWHGIPMTSSQVPFYDEGGKLLGVAGYDVNVAAISEQVNKPVLSNSGYFVILDEKGTLGAFSPDPKLAKTLKNYQSVPELAKVWREIQTAESGLISLDGQYWAYRRIATTNWLMLAAVPQSVVLMPVLAASMGSALAIALLLAIVVGLFARKLNRRLQPILDRCNQLAGTKIAQDLLQQQDEIDQVSTAFFNLLATQERNTKQLEMHNEILTSLAQNETILQGDAKSAAQSITEAAAIVLGIERTSIWLYNSDKSALTCFDLYQQEPNEHSEGTELKAVDFPAYFQALRSEPFLVASDAHVHPATREFSSSYLMPLGIASMLDVPIQISGQAVGVLCCEHVAQVPKEWTLQEQSFATSLANLMSLGMENQLTQTEVGHLLDIVSSVEEGDLQVRARISDRPMGLVSDTFNRLIEELVAVLSQVLNTAQQVSQGANNLEQIATTVATNADRQAQSVEQVLHLSEQVKQSTQATGVQVQETNQSLEALSVAVGEGKTVISNLTQGIGVLQHGTDRIIQQMKTLGEFVGLADQFVQEQSQIASATQILSMNAALVAARAAEQRNPKQFAGVAREFESIAGQVSNLAQKTNDGLSLLEQRTAQIHSVVAGIDREVQNLGGLVSSFNQGVEQSERVFQNVQAVSSEAGQAGEAIASSSQEIANISQSTSSALQDVAQLAQKTAQLTQKTKQQSEAIGQLSGQLLQRIKFFRLPVSTLPPPELEAPLNATLSEEIFGDLAVAVTAQNK
jgi:methyl-accepting chemotaxis protein